MHRKPAQPSQQLHTCLFIHAETLSLVSHQAQTWKKQLTCKGAQRLSFCSLVCFSKHNILGAYDDYDMCQHVSLRHLVQTMQVGKTRSLDPILIRAADTKYTPNSPLGTSMAVHVVPGGTW